MAAFSGLRIYPFGGSGVIHGLLAVFQRRAYVLGASQRGFFYRIGANIFSPKEGYFDSTFALKTKVWEIDLMLKVKMKDEIIAVRFRPNWIHGSLYFSRSGCISFIFTAIDPNRFPKMEGASLEEIATAAVYGDGFNNKNGEERKQLDSY